MGPVPGRAISWATLNFLVALVALGVGSAACGSVTSPSSHTYATAWSGHGELAFVAKGRLHVMRDDGERLSISGPPTSGSDTSPAWSFDHRWLAFFSDVAGSTPYAEPLQTLGSSPTDQRMPGR